MSLDFSSLTSDITPETIKAEMAARVSQAGVQADLREGSYTDILLSTAAYLCYKCWAQFPAVLAAGVVGPDSGPYLDSFGAMFGLTRTAAAAAHVVLTFSGTDGTVIPALTAARTAEGLRYLTDEEGVIASGTAAVPATAEEAGAAYNTAAGTITSLTASLAGVSAVTNAQGAEGGADIESDAAFYERIHTRLSTPVGSGNSAYYEQLALEVPGVGQAKTLPLWDGPGTVKVVLASADKQPVDTAVVTAAQAALEEGRVIGAEVTAVSAAALTVNVAAACTLEDGVSAEDVEDELAQRLEEMFEEMTFGVADSVRLNQVALRLLSCEGVVDYASLQLNGAAENLSKTAEQVAVVGTVTITEGGS